jgi:hypothetical protein
VSTIKNYLGIFKTHLKDKVYGSGTPCMFDDKEWFESVHLRFEVLRYQEKDLFKHVASLTLNDEHDPVRLALANMGIHRSMIDKWLLVPVDDYHQGVIETIIDFFEIAFKEYPDSATAEELLQIIDWNLGERDKMNLMVKAFESHLGGPREAIYFIIDATVCPKKI